MNNKIVYKAGKIFNGNETLPHYAVIVTNGIIESVMPASSVHEDAETIDFGDALIAPAFIDLQLYGAHSRLLAVYPDDVTVAAIYNYCLNGGAAYCMPTVATHPYNIIFSCVDAIKGYWAKNGKGVLGLHVEGPWISMAKRGAHNEEWISVPTIEQAKELLEYGKNVIKIITLAPEVCSREIIELIEGYGVVVSAGHTNATYEQAMQGFNDGIHTATHLYNAMSSLQHRAPGMVGAIFDNPSAHCSIVADGYHVDYAAIRIAKKIMGERLFAITDAVTETREGFYRHTPEGDKYTANGILSGSALTMHKAFTNLVNHCGISVEEALRMCSLYPARVMNMPHKIGFLGEGCNADMIVLNNDLQLVKVITS
jgi:N-acetylglucosamine-6-phosphate deacetylase